MVRLLDSHAERRHFLIRRNHLLSVSAEHRLLNSQELAPHEESVLIRSHLLKEVAENRHDLLQERMVGIALAVSHLLLERVLESKLHSEDGLFGSLSHKDHRINQNSLVDELILLHGLLIILDFGHVAQHLLTPLDRLTVESGCIGSIHGLDAE